MPIHSSKKNELGFVRVKQLMSCVFVFSLLLSSAICFAWSQMSPIGAAQQQVVQQNSTKQGKLTPIKLPEPEPFKTKDGKIGWKLKIPGGRPLATPAVKGGALYVGGGFGSHEFYAVDAKTGKTLWTFRCGDDGPTAAVVAEGCVAYNTESCTLYLHDAKSGKVLWHKWLGDPLMSQPAIADGRVFMAYPGKDGSHHLAAFGLRTGKVLWDKKIAAEVITAPVVADGSVYAATTDGSVYRFTARDGKRIWTVKCNATSAPRIMNAKVYISHRHVRTVEIDVEEDGKTSKKSSQITVEGFNLIDATDGTLAFDKPRASVKASYLLGLDRGRAALEQNRRLYFYGQSGYRAYGATQAQKIVQSTEVESDKAADLKHRMQRFMGRKASSDAQVANKDAREAEAIAEMAEALAGEMDAAGTPDERERAANLRKAAKRMKEGAGNTLNALDAAKQLQVMVPAMQRETAAAQHLDSSVGFGSAPAAAKLGLAKDNIGQSNVKAVWAFQGSRPCPIGNRIYAMQGNRFRAVILRAKKPLWEHVIETKAPATRPTTPPALAGGRFYFGTVDGRIVCADAANGEALWEAEVGGRILFEPAVVEGRVYAATDDGTLICLETGDPKADGWAMWGGSARHNGAVQARP